MHGYFKTFILLAAMTALVTGCGYLLGGEGGMMMGFGFALAMNVLAYWNSDKIVLRYYKAKEVNEKTAPDFYRMMQMLSQNANLPMPKIYIIENEQPNAFATGRNPQNAAVAATTGLLQRLNQAEIAGVMAHELAHIKNRDTLIMTVTATLAGALSMIANFAMFFGGSRDRNNGMGIIGVLVVAFLAPLAASIVQMAISRAREYEADKVGAQICGKPNWLADALEKIALKAGEIDNEAAEGNPATAHMFIINPLHVHKIDGLFSTHPPTAERIRRLRAMVI